MFVSEDYIVKKMTEKRNWMVEYLMVKKTVDKISNFDMSLCKYEIIHENRNTKIITIKNCIHNVIEPKANFFYNCLIKTKCERSYMEKYWSKIFDRNITRNQWENIYMNGIHSLPSTKFIEFAYKMIHGLLVEEILYVNGKKLIHQYVLCVKEKKMLSTFTLNVTGYKKSGIK